MAAPVFRALCHSRWEPHGCFRWPLQRKAIQRHLRPEQRHNGLDRACHPRPVAVPQEDASHGVRGVAGLRCGRSQRRPGWLAGRLPHPARGECPAVRKRGSRPARWLHASDGSSAKPLGVRLRLPPPRPLLPARLGPDRRPSQPSAAAGRVRGYVRASRRDCGGGLRVHRSAPDTRRRRALAHL